MKDNRFSRRELLKKSTLLALGAPLLGSKMGVSSESDMLAIPQDMDSWKPDKPLTAVVLGAGNRGNTYSGYSLKFPDELKIVGVAEPIEFRRKRFAKKYQIPEDRQWVTWEHALKVAKFADALIITTPDHLHYGPAMGGLKLGYDMVLEKPISQTWKQCNDIMNLTVKTGRIVAICHVLRYTPYFRKMREIMQSGQIGEIVSIQHLEPVEHIHMSHSFVRGNWRNSKESNPMILAKSCHDLDILRWMIGKPCTSISSYGSLSYFIKAHAPEGSTLRCTGGCKVEATCPFSALKIYYRNRTWLSHMDLPEEGDKGPAIMKHLQEGPYGRCVFRCDNDVVDHQITNMEFGGKITAAFSMEALTSYAGRRTRIMGTKGDLVGDENVLTVFDFESRKETSWDARTALKMQSGHGGGDYGLLHDFIRAVSTKDPKVLTSTIQESMESHLMAFKAEESRHSGKTIAVKMT
jgi:predicted dehydrogenase